jgi:hypothetical protein
LVPILLTVKQYAAPPLEIRHPKPQPQSKAADFRLAFAGFLLSGRQLDSVDRFGRQSHRVACREDCGWLETILGRCSAPTNETPRNWFARTLSVLGRKLKHAQTGDSLSHEQINANR